MAEQVREKLLEVKDLHVVFGKGKRAFEAIKGVSFDIYKGPCWGIRIGKDYDWTGDHPNQ